MTEVRVYVFMNSKNMSERIENVCDCEIWNIWCIKLQYTLSVNCVFDGEYNSAKVKNVKNYSVKKLVSLNKFA